MIKRSIKPPNSVVLSILLLLSLITNVVGQNTIEGAIRLFNAKSDTAIYYKQEPFLNHEYNYLNPTIISINEALLKNDFTLLQYTGNQYLIVPINFSEETMASIIRKNKLDKAIENSKSQNLTDVFVLEATPLNKERTLTINTVIVDVESNNAIIAANIFNLTTGDHYNTNAEGQITMLLEPSSYKLKLTAIGFEERTIDLFLKGSGTLTIPMKQVSVQLDEVLVTEKSGANLRSPIVGLQRLTMKQIKNLPSLMGQTDILKSLVILPGVSTNSDGIGGISVRGGNADQNLILLDDISYFNPNHALGFLSSFNPDFINSVSLFKGYIPPKYGGRIASVLSAETRSPNNKKWIKRVGLGLSNSSVSIEGPIFKEKTSIALGARLSHANWMIKLINEPAARQSRLNFHDYQIKLEHRLSKTNAIGINLYNGSDAFNLLGEAGFKYTTKNQQVYLKQTIGLHTNVNLKYSSSDYSSSLNDLLAQNPIYLISGIKNKNAKLSITSLFKDIEFNYGAEYNDLKIAPAFFASNEKEKSSRYEKVRDISLFGELKKEIVENLTFNVGARFVKYASRGASKVYMYGEGKKSIENIIDSLEIAEGQTIKSFNYLEPRLSLNYNINENNSIKLGYTQNHQFVSMLSNSIAPTPIDFWKGADTYFQPQFAKSYFMSYNNSTYKANWESSLELYYTTVDNVQEFKDFANLYENQHLETDILFGRGKNYGAEISVVKNNGKLTGRLSYTYSRSLKQINRENQDIINQGRWYPNLVDKPHDINLLLTYNFTRRLNFNLLFNYNTGQPVTIPINRFSDWNAGSILFYGERNAYRLPDYHRMDLSINLLPGYNKKNKVKTSWNFSVQNIYGRKNAYSLFFRQKPFEKVVTYKYAVLGTILPAITLNLEW